MSGWTNVGRPAERLGVPRILLPTAEAILAFLCGGCFYVALYGALPYHDAARFADQVNSGRYVWDIGHIFLQPATLLWHNYLGFGESAERSQKHINTFATAVAIVIFYLLMFRLRFPTWRRVLASVLLAGSGSVIILAPTSHMKLLAFPFVNAALYCLVTWEGRRRPGNKLWLLGAGALLAVAGAFLASCLATVPFACLAVLLTSWRRTGALRPAFTDAIMFGGLCTAIFGLCVVIGYVSFAGQPFSLAGVHASVMDKADLRTVAVAPQLSIATLARVVFGTSNNFALAPDLGPYSRAFLLGEIRNLTPYITLLLPQFIAFTLSAIVVATVYLRSAWVAALRTTACCAPLAFLCGAQAWSIWYGLNDPEHWFQLSAPTILLFLMNFPAGVIRLALPVWSVGTLAWNLAVFSLPQRDYPLHRYEAEIQSTYTSHDMFVYFAEYPGTPYLGFFTLSGIQRLRVDDILKSEGRQKGLEDIKSKIDAVLHIGGRVIVFSILDPRDWNGAWSSLPSLGIHKQDLDGFFNAAFVVLPLGRIAEMPAWELTNKPTTR